MTAQELRQALEPHAPAARILIGGCGREKKIRATVGDLQQEFKDRPADYELPADFTWELGDQPEEPETT